jgi:hypothetical protein
MCSAAFLPRPRLPPVTMAMGVLVEDGMLCPFRVVEDGRKFIDRSNLDKYKEYDLFVRHN